MGYDITGGKSKKLMDESYDNCLCHISCQYSYTNLLNESFGFDFTTFSGRITKANKRKFIIGIDNMFPYLSKLHIDLILKFIKKKKISLINVINNGEYLKYTDFAAVLNEGKCAIKTSVKELLSGNSILPYIGVKLPFAVELSNNLMLYGLIDKIEYDNDSLEVKLWK